MIETKPSCEPSDAIEAYFWLMQRIRIIAQLVVKSGFSSSEGGQNGTDSAAPERLL